MNFDRFIDLVPSNGLFRTGQLLAGVRRPQDLRRQLSRWVDAGKVVQLRRGVYLLNAPYAKLSVHSFVVANALQRASYVSLQSALSHYGMIPEYVPVTTSITTGRPEELSVALGRFQFRHIAKQRFSGFSEIEVTPGQHALLATPYKALVDLLYLTPHSDDIGYLGELRITRPHEFEDEQLFRVAKASQSAKVERAVKLLASVWETF